MNLEQEAKKKRRMTREGKRTIDHDINTELIVKFFRASTVDDRTLLQPYYGPSYYRVMAWTDPEDEYGTQVVKVPYGYDPWMFDKQLVIPLDSPARYLYIELIRGASWRDPGTSNGTVVMGRGKIPLPPPTSRGAISRKVSLVVLNSDRCVEEKGTLEISMKLHRYVS